MKRILFLFALCISVLSMSAQQEVKVYDSYTSNRMASRQMNVYGRWTDWKSEKSYHKIVILTNLNMTVNNGEATTTLFYVKTESDVWTDDEGCKRFSWIAIDASETNCQVEFIVWPRSEEHPNGWRQIYIRYGNVQYCYE